MTFLHLLSYVGIVAAFAFVTLSLASGLLWIAELIEEHSRLAKVVGIRTVYVIIGLHVGLYFFDSLPFGHLLFSIICHLTYLQNFSATWPFISLSSVTFIASCLFAVVNHFVWFLYFSRRAQEARHRSPRFYRGPNSDGLPTSPGFADVATFFALCVWLVPLFLFLSLSANDNALPIDSGIRGVPTSNPPQASGSYEPVSTSRSSLFKSFMDLLPRIRRKNRPAEGIIAPPPPSPLPHSMPSTPAPSSSTFSQGLGYPATPIGAPPLSPSPSGQSRLLDETQGRTRVSLRPPPKRAVTGPTPQRRSADGEWIDLSESVSTSSAGLGLSRVMSRSPSKRLHAE